MNHYSDGTTRAQRTILTQTGSGSARGHLRQGVRRDEQHLPFRHQRGRYRTSAPVLRIGVRLEVRGLGPPDFYQITTGDADDPGVRGALQRRRDLAPGLRLNSFEPTFAVTDVDATAAALRANGARILMERTTIGGVGHLIFFEDTEGNVAGAMQYDSQAE